MTQSSDGPYCSDLWVGDDLEQLVAGVPTFYAAEGSNLHGQVVVLVAGSEDYDQSGALLTPLKICDDSNTALKYTGTWSQPATSGSWGGKVAKAANAAAVTLKFTGKTVSVIGPSGPGLGSATIYIDGANAGALTESGPSATRTRVFRTSFAAAGSHTLKIVATVGFELDAVTTTQY